MNSRNTTFNAQHANIMGLYLLPGVDVIPAESRHVSTLTVNMLAC